MNLMQYVEAMREAFATYREKVDAAHDEFVSRMRRITAEFQGEDQPEPDMPYLGKH